MTESMRNGDSMQCVCGCALWLLGLLVNNLQCDPEIQEMWGNFQSVCINWHFIKQFLCIEIKVGPLRR